MSLESRIGLGLRTAANPWPMRLLAVPPLLMLLAIDLAIHITGDSFSPGVSMIVWVWRLALVVATLAALVRTVYAFHCVRQLDMWPPELVLSVAEGYASRLRIEIERRLASTQAPEL